MDFINHQILAYVKDAVQRQSISNDDWELFLVELYRMIGRLQTDEISSSDRMVDCEVGCAYCCNHWVEDVYFYEGIVIKRYLERHHLSEITRIKAESERSEQHFFKLFEENPAWDEITLLNKFYELKIPCPLLDSTGKCTIYPVRPLTCRGFFSSNRELFCRPPVADDKKNGTFMILPSEEIQSLLDDLHICYSDNTSTALRSILTFVM